MVKRVLIIVMMFCVISAFTHYIVTPEGEVIVYHDPLQVLEYVAEQEGIVGSSEGSYGPMSDLMENAEDFAECVDSLKSSIDDFKNENFFLAVFNVLLSIGRIFANLVKGLVILISYPTRALISVVKTFWYWLFG